MLLLKVGGVFQCTGKQSGCRACCALHQVACAFQVFDGLRACVGTTCGGVVKRRHLLDCYLLLVVDFLYGGSS